MVVNLSGSVGCVCVWRVTDEGCMSGGEAEWECRVCGDAGQWQCGAGL